MNLDKWSKKRLHGDRKRRSGAKDIPIFLKIKTTYCIGWTWNSASDIGTFRCRGQVEAFKVVYFAAGFHIAHYNTTPFSATETRIFGLLAIYSSATGFALFASFWSFAVLRFFSWASYSVLVVGFGGFSADKSAAIGGTTVAWLLSSFSCRIIDHVLGALEIVVERQFRLGRNVLDSEKTNSCIAQNGPFLRLTIGLARVVHKARQITARTGIDNARLVQRKKVVTFVLGVLFGF